MTTKSCCMYKPMKTTHKQSRLTASFMGALALLVLAGCASVSPQHVNTDRMDYGQVIADSWKRQTLMHVVRLRYADAPVFLDVSSIINSYTVGGNANAGATLPAAPIRMCSSSAPRATDPTPRP